jgi:hypothetical protein
MENFRSENLVIVKAGILKEIIEKAVTGLILINQEQRDNFIRTLIKDVIGNESTVITNLNEVSDGHRNIATEIIERIGKETKLSSHPELFSRVVSVVYGTMNDYRNSMERKTESRFKLNKPVVNPTDVATAGTESIQEPITPSNNIESLVKLVGNLHLSIIQLTNRIEDIENKHVPSYLSKDGESHTSSHQEGF